MCSLCFVRQLLIVYCDFKGVCMKIGIIGLRGLSEGLGGVEKVVKETSVRLFKMGFDITCFCRHKYSTDNVYEGVKLLNIKTLNTKHGETAVYAIRSMLQIIRTDFDLIHIHALASAFLAWIPKIFGKKVVTTIHGLDWQRAKWGVLARVILRLGEWCAVHFSDCIICVSLSLYTYFKMRYPDHNIVYIPNGCDNYIDVKLDPPCGLEKKSYLLYMGRLVPEKGAHKLLKVFLSLNTDMKLVIAGGTSFTSGYETRLKKLAEGCDRVIFPGVISGVEKEKYLVNAYAFVMPSEIEGLPIALLESCSRGICPIVSAIPTTIEVLGDFDISRGFLFDPYSQTQLKVAIESCIDNPELTKALGERAKERVEKTYNWDVISQSLYHLYNLVCADHQQGNNDEY